LVIFDIPEAYRKHRVAFRNKLKQLGFAQFQKSVWIHPYECENEISFLTEFLNISQYLTLITASIENDEAIQKLFQNTLKDCRSANVEEKQIGNKTASSIMADRQKLKGF
jgi:DNA-binding transcriptional regulator PaaX